MLQLQLKAPDGTAILDLKSLRFYLRGDAALVTTLYELLTCHVDRVHVVAANDDQVQTPPQLHEALRLPEESIRMVGFDLDEAVLPHPPHSHPGYRLLTEYFTFPKKFHFFEVNNIDLHKLQSGKPPKAFDIHILFKRNEHLDSDRMKYAGRAVKKETFSLGCTPIVNLFPNTTEPVRVDHKQTEYPLIPDVRHLRTTEIHSIQNVIAVSEEGTEVKPLAPFYGLDHTMAMRNYKAFWIASRLLSSRQDIPGTEMQVSFVDLDFNPRLPRQVQTVYAETLCTNRYLAEQLPPGAELQIEKAVPLRCITCLDKPTRQVPPPLRGAALWRLISHLSLNHLSVSSGHESLQALRAILQLHTMYDRPSTYDQIMGIEEILCHRVVRRIGKEAWAGFARGIEITLVLNEEYFSGRSAILLAAVLNRFLSLYVSVNGFTQLVVKKSKQREGIWKKWPPMAGQEKIL